MVEVAPSMTVVDLSIRGLSPGTYHATVREAGDISEGPESTGGIWEALKAKQEGKPCRGIFGTVEVDKGGIGSVFLDRPIQIWEMIGRSIVVARQQDGKVGQRFAASPTQSLTSCSSTKMIQTHWSVLSREVPVCGTVSASVISQNLHFDIQSHMLTLFLQTIRQYALVQGRLCGKRERNNATAVCCENLMPGTIKWCP